MKIRLGYVALSKTLDNITTSSTITYTNYEKLNDCDKLNRLYNIINYNLDSLEQILNYNIKNNIHFYRLTSKLIPLITHPLVNYDYKNKFKNKFLKLGNLINKNNIRVDVHPDEYCVLNSTNKSVINSSIIILKYHKNMLEYLNIKNPKIILHVGSSVFGKDNSIKRFKNNFNKLNNELKKMIIIENDDKIYNILDILNLCNDLKIPMVLDYHHYLCNNNGEDIKDYINKIFDTWKQENIIPKIHFSSPKSKLKKEYRSHNDYINADDFINFIEQIKFIDRDFDIMLEAKMKDEALFKLVRELKYKTNYKFIDDTSFIVV